jgi:hypothetical protein
VEKVALFCNPALGARSQALQLRLKIGYKFAAAKAKMFLHLEARFRVSCRTPHFKGQIKLVNGSVIGMRYKQISVAFVYSIL